jgi:tetratricopeptide (TPR) repeat protein
MRRPSSNQDAVRLFLEAEDAFTTISAEQWGRCRESFERAVELDGDFARALGELSYALIHGVAAGFCDKKESEAVMERAMKLAERAVELDADDYANRWNLAFALMSRKRFDEAVDEYGKALRLFETATDRIDRKPGLLAEMGEALVFAGRPREGMAMIERAITRVPDWYRWNMGFACYCAREYARAIDELGRMYRKPGDPRYVIDVQLLAAACHAQLGADAEAERALDLFRAAKPDWTIKQELLRTPFRNAADEAHWIEGLRKAGLPEG